MYHLRLHISLTSMEKCWNVCKTEHFAFFLFFNIWGWEGSLLRNTPQEKADFHCRVSAVLFTLGTGIELLRAGSTQPHFFINHSMAVPIHPSIHGPCENTRRHSRVCNNNMMRQERTHSWHSPWTGVWTFASGTEKGWTSRPPPPAPKRRRDAKTKKSCQTGEEWREKSWYFRNVERREVWTRCSGEGRGGEGEDRRSGGDVPPAAHVLTFAFQKSVFYETRVQSEPQGCLKPQQHNRVFIQDNVSFPFNTYSSHSRKGGFIPRHKWQQYLKVCPPPFFLIPAFKSNTNKIQA